MNDYRWDFIKPLTERERAIDLASMRPLYDAWRMSRLRLRESSEDSFRGFMQRLVRRLSVETGILERIYDLDRGTTEALVAKGFVEDLVSRSSTDIEPSRLIDILRDQEAAIQVVMDCVAQHRALTKGVVHELHAILTKHQDTTAAIDQFGERHEILLLKGRFKEHPNNPRRPDGTMHEYCPPIHVDAEMERLLQWFSESADDDPILVAAWLHHRFTQIHPYQDGNGRVARALITLVLLRAELLPLVIDRDLRLEYLEALEAADHGDLSRMVSMFARLEKAAILQALSVDIDAEVATDRSLTSAVIERLADKLGRRRQDKEVALRRVNDVALALRRSARKIVEEGLSRLGAQLRPLTTPLIHVADGGPDRENAHWYRYEVAESASAGGKYANLTEDHYFIKASIRADLERLVFVISFHHVGRELSGIMEATAFLRLESYEDSDEREVASRDFFVCSHEPFVFTYQSAPSDIADSFARWLDVALAVAIKEYGDRL